MYTDITFIFSTPLSMLYIYNIIHKNKPHAHKANFVCTSIIFVCTAHLQINIIKKTNFLITRATACACGLHNVIHPPLCIYMYCTYICMCNMCMRMRSRAYEGAAVFVNNTYKERGATKTLLIL